ncbi:hypothetical protein ACQCU3_00320 [Bacillus altitudinis]|uniref:hypothetical protein n=1 Tax=Bacillus altitudinis TaxID=293387 RepID=UPI0011E904CC|nr:hypothetical protein [Bacillus altitudinis]TYS29927.1 hypothetical protein FZC69_02640 [Bacillus altitudinis]
MSIHYKIITESFNHHFADVDTQLKQRMWDLSDVLEIIDYDETVYYSNELYDQFILNDKQIIDWLYDSDSDSDSFRDEKTLLQQILRRMESVEEDDILNSIEQLRNKKYDQKKALISFYNWSHSAIDPNLIIKTKDNCYLARRFHLKFLNNSNEFFHYLESCFPHLYVNENVKTTLRRLKPFSDYNNEIIRHLVALNDTAPPLLREHGLQNDTDLLKRLSSSSNIECSNQGNPSYEKKILSFNFPTDEGEQTLITCAPHTKLFNKHSGQRIYFNWGNQKVKKGEKILIGHIGVHL